MPRAHVLVVDDEPAILTTLQKALSLEGYAVEVAGGVQVAEQKLGKKSFDLCILDVQLPDGDGVDLLRRIRPGNPELSVLMMSGQALTATQQRQLGIISSSTENLARFIDEILDLSKLQAGRMNFEKTTLPIGEILLAV